jgi:hypothetical protein
MKRALFGSVVLVVIALAGSTTFAKTPDGETPAEETVCADLAGAAFGLCNAYCEAQDCDVHPRPSCERLRASLEKITGSSLFPCDAFCGDGVVNQADEECEPPGSLCSQCFCPDPCPDPCVCFCTSLPETCSDDCTCTPQRCGESEFPTCGGLCPDGGICTPDTGVLGCLCLPPPPLPCGDRGSCGGTCLSAAGNTGLCQPLDGVCDCLPPPPPPCGVTADGQCGGSCTDPTLECRRSGSGIADCACLPPPPPPQSCEERQECGGDCILADGTNGKCRQLPGTTCACAPPECLQEGSTGCFGTVEIACCLCQDGTNGDSCVDAPPDQCFLTPGCALVAGTCGNDGACVIPPPPPPCCPGSQCLPPGICLPVGCADRAQCGGPCGDDLSGTCGASSIGCGCNSLSGGG